MVSIQMRSTYAGIATVPINTKTVTVTHGIGAIPTIVLLTAQGAISGGYFGNAMWISAKTATTFTITLTSNVTAALPIGWLAIL